MQFGARSAVATSIRLAGFDVREPFDKRKEAGLVYFGVHSGHSAPRIPGGNGAAPDQRGQREQYSVAAALLVP